MSTATNTAGLAAWLERQAEVRHATACNEGDRWDAQRLAECAKELRRLHGYDLKQAKAKRAKA